MSDAHLSEDERIDAAFDALPPARLAHAERCAVCARAVSAARMELRAGAAAFELLAPPPPLEPAVAERTLATIQSRVATRRAGTYLPALLCALTSAALIAPARSHDDAAVAWLTAGLAVLAARLAFTRFARIASLVAASSALALATIASAPDGVVELSAGLRCLRLELVVGLVVGAVTARVALARHERWSAAAVCGAGALAAQAGVTLNCHGSGGHAHTLLFHALGVILALALGPALTRLSRPSIATP